MRIAAGILFLLAGCVNVALVNYLGVFTPFFFIVLLIGYLAVAVSMFVNQRWLTSLGCVLCLAAIAFSIYTVIERLQTLAIDEEDYFYRYYDISYIRKADGYYYSFLPKHYFIITLVVRFIYWTFLLLAGGDRSHTKEFGIVACIIPFMLCAYLISYFFHDYICYGLGLIVLAYPASLAAIFLGLAEYKKYNKQRDLRKQMIAGFAIMKVERLSKLEALYSKDFISEDELDILVEQIVEE